MKLVIEIDSYVLEHCKRHAKEHYANNIEEAIANGTPLPKGHGNLVDIDKLYDTVFNPRNGILEIYKDRPIEQLENELESVFDNASTIIEADKEASDG